MSLNLSPFAFFSAVPPYLPGTRAPAGHSGLEHELRVLLITSHFSRSSNSVTRTLHFGTPTAFEKRAYTRVLQGHIAIDEAVFPSTTTGFMLDPWARKALWKDGLGRSIHPRKEGSFPTSGSRPLTSL